MQDPGIHETTELECFYRLTPSISVISHCTFSVQHVHKTKLQVKVHQTLGGRLIEMKTIGKLSWGWPKGGRSSLIEVAA